MKTIQLNGKHTLQMPESVDELPYKILVKSHELLLKVYANLLSPAEFKLYLLVALTRYRASGKLTRQAFKKLLSSKQVFDRWRLDQELKQEYIQYNLLYLSQQIDLFFTLDDRTIVPSFRYSDNPFGKRFKTAAHFSKSVTVSTDITAKEFADCIDLLSAVNSSPDNLELYQHCLCEMASILLRTNKSKAKKLNPVIHFGLMLWFSSVTIFFKNHPVYGVLYQNNKTDTGIDKINLGMSEVLLFLHKEGYQQSESMNLIDFFNAQVKALKDNLSSAIASGADLNELSIKTGIPVTDIQRLL